LLPAFLLIECLYKIFGVVFRLGLEMAPKSSNKFLCLEITLPIIRYDLLYISCDYFVNLR